jgi:hypothetical protein
VNFTTEKTELYYWKEEFNVLKQNLSIYFSIAHWLGIYVGQDSCDL